MASPLIASASFTSAGRLIHKGAEVDADDPIAVRFPSLFEAADTAPTPLVEQATAEPGERRTVGTPAGGSTPPAKRARKAPAKRARKAPAKRASKD